MNKWLKFGLFILAVVFFLVVAFFAMRFGWNKIQEIRAEAMQQKEVAGEEGEGESPNGINTEEETALAEKAESPEEGSTVEEKEEGYVAEEIPAEEETAEEGRGVINFEKEFEHIAANPPENFPTNWASLTSVSQAEWVSGETGCPVVPVLGEPGVAFAFNAKGVTTYSCTCPVGFTCHWHVILPDGREATVFFAGHGEYEPLAAGTFRIESELPNNETFCDNWANVQLYEASIGNVVFPFGEEIGACPALTALQLQEVDPELGERLMEVVEMSGAPVISIGSVGAGYGAFQVYASFTQDLVCPEYFQCYVKTDENVWQWFAGGDTITGAYGAILFDPAIVDPVTEAAALVK